ncbi:unnamed protein product [Polarella glacialis]|uniref:Methyltransferase domain-containing protein n=1 Tax=Polarella glacialis TaxID=89957 RepID=A0A813F6T4_POLGL|nr:unnamed protein product [Polarella glacialis]
MVQMPGGRFIQRSFQNEQYLQFEADSSRTSAYYHAIDELVPGRVVLDLGTGALALLALRCARAGARHVYAVEASPDVAQMARHAVAAAGYAEQVTVLTGRSQELDLPQQVDVVVHELFGEIASSEGVAHALRDALARHVCKRSLGRRAWSIPSRAATWATPVELPPKAFFQEDRRNADAVSEAAGNLFDDPLFLHGFPVADLALAEPMVLEELYFSEWSPVDNERSQDPRDSASPGSLECQVQRLAFVVQRAGSLAGFAFHITVDCGGSAPSTSSAEAGSHWAHGFITAKPSQRWPMQPESTHSLEHQVDCLIAASNQLAVKPGDVVELEFRVDLLPESPRYDISARLRRFGISRQAEWSDEELFDTAFICG